MTSAHIYNEKRRILFSTYHSKGAEVAFSYLEKYKAALGPQGYAGLRAELEFYNKYSHEFSLTVAGDMGEHADFAGMMGRVPVRFDVTTNVKYKDLKLYEKFVCDGFDYKIAIFDKQNWEIIDVLELAFPRCASCGDSCRFPVAIMGPQNYNRHGDPLWHSDQQIIEFCPCCGDTIKRIDIANSSLLSLETLYGEASTFDDEESSDNFLSNGIQASVKYLEKTSGIALAGLATEGTHQEHKYAEEEHGLYFPYLSNAVRRYFPSFFSF